MAENRCNNVRRRYQDTEQWIEHINELIDEQNSGSLPVDITVKSALTASVVMHKAEKNMLELIYKYTCS
jgi:hypothetical protein